MAENNSEHIMPTLDLLPVSKSDLLYTRKKIGEGSFGSCIKVKFKVENDKFNINTDDYYVLKQLSDSKVQESWLRKRLLKEILVIGQLHMQHENLVSVYACLISGSDQLDGYVMEHCIQGDMRKFLSKIRNTHVDNRFLWLSCQLLFEVSNGLKFLQDELNPPVMHQDVALDNILITSNLIAKIADFGLAKHVESAMTSHSVDFEKRKRTTVRRPPENYDGCVLEENVLYMDRWQYGLCVLEAVTNRNLSSELQSHIDPKDYTRMVQENRHIPSFRGSISRAFNNSETSDYQQLHGAVLDIITTTLCLTPTKRKNFTWLCDKWNACLKTHSIKKEKDLLLKNQSAQTNSSVSSFSKPVIIRSKDLSIEFISDQSSSSFEMPSIQYEEGEIVAIPSIEEDLDKAGINIDQVFKDSAMLWQFYATVDHVADTKLVSVLCNQVDGPVIVPNQDDHLHMIERGGAALYTNPCKLEMAGILKSKYHQSVYTKLFTLAWNGEDLKALGIMNKLKTDSDVPLDIKVVAMEVVHTVHSDRDLTMLINALAMTDRIECNNTSILKCRLHRRIAGLFYREKKYDLAQEHLTTAIQLADYIEPDIDTIYTYRLKAVMLLEDLKNEKDQKKWLKLKNSSSQFFHKAFDQCRQLVEWKKLITERIKISKAMYHLSIWEDKKKFYFDQGKFALFDFVSTIDELEEVVENTLNDVEIAYLTDGDLAFMHMTQAKFYQLTVQLKVEANYVDKDDAKGREELKIRKENGIKYAKLAINLNKVLGFPDRSQEGEDILEKLQNLIV